MSLFGFLKREKSCRLLADPEDIASKKYRQFKELLSRNDEVLDALAALEQTYYGGEAFTMGAARQTCLQIGQAIESMAKALDALSQGRYPGMLEALGRILGQALDALKPTVQAPEGSLAISLGDVGPGQARLAGGKGANLAQVRNVLKLPAPDGFVLTTASFAAFMEHTGLAQYAAQELDPASPLDLPDLKDRCARIREAILTAPFPAELAKELSQALTSLAARLAGRPKLAVRSSAVGEDSAASFAGQYDSVLGVSFEEAEQACKKVFASKYSPHAVLYRLRHGLDDADAPMAVLVVEMVEAKASGVLYTLDPAHGAAPVAGGCMRLDAVAGLGDRLVSGEVLPAEFALSREPMAVTVRPGEAPLSEAQALNLGAMGLRLEKHFGSPQDVEWCLDERGEAFIIQSRPLEVAGDSVPVEAVDISGHEVLLTGGVAASPGAASGEVLPVAGSVPREIPEGAILVAKNAAPELAALLDRAGGIVTELGGAASHLASVAREMGVPALFGIAGSVETLPQGRTVTLDATGKRVLDGRVEALLSQRSLPGSTVVNSPMHRRLRAALDRVSPLTLTDPGAPNFTPQGCETLHDLVRFAHETGMRAMFGLCGRAEEGDVLVAKLKAQIPLNLFCVDLGGGLRQNLTTCDDITPEDIRSIPMRAIWRGFTHPGITWSGTVAFDARSFMTLVAASATAEVGGGSPGGDSYAMLGQDYVNLSARFGYHFANVDAFCGEETTRNHVTLRFAGGVGGFSGKCLRVAFLAGVLSRLGFLVEANGDVLDASFTSAPARQTEDVLDQLGRLLASSRLLDMAITNQAAVDEMTEAFLRGDYDLLSNRRENPLPHFHLVAGDWERVQDEQQGDIARQNGSKWGTGLSKSFLSVAGKQSGRRYQKFLDSIEAFFYFPLAVAKDSEMGDGRASLRVRPVSGSIDQAGGLTFAIRSSGTYLVLRLNALEDNLILFAFKDGNRSELASAHLPVDTGQWRELAVDVQGNTVTCSVDAKPYIVHHFDEPPRGLLGLWTKADSVTDFQGLTMITAQGERTFSV